MPTPGVYDLKSAAAGLLKPLHKTLPNGMVSCSLNSEIVLEFINNPLLVPRSLRTTGDYNECEHAREPDYRLPSSPWHAYIPVDDSFPTTDVKSWVFEDSIPQIEWFVPTYGSRGRISPAFLNKVATVIRDALRWLPTLYAISGTPPVPPSLQLSDLRPLESFHGSYDEGATEVWRVRRSVLITWGYVIYSLSIRQDWQDHAAVTQEFIQDITSSRLLNLPRRGLIINAQDPPPFSDVISYLQHRIPVHYYWEPGCIYWLDPAATHSVNLFPDFSHCVTSHPDSTEGLDGPEDDHTLPSQPASPHSLAPSRPSTPAPSFPLKCAPGPQVMDCFNHTVAIHNDKTEYILRAFNTPHVSFNSTFRAPKIPLPDRLTFITSGRLEISKRTEVRLHLWRSQYPTLPLWFFAYHCLSHGLDWRVFTRLTDLAHPALEHPPPKPPHLQADPRPLTKGSSLLVDYVRRVQALLQQPNARRFLTMGGVIWRIALHYGPAGFFAAASSGPSVDATVHLHFDEGDDHTTVDDRVSEAEIALLLGITENGSIWPTLDIWERNEHWCGEWNAKSERWFQFRIRQIESSAHFSLHTRKQWKAAIRRHTARAFSNSGTVGTEAHAERVCLELDELFPLPESITYL
ncbi:hypothetical protein BDR03DRAFT_1009492 [Suillus americanus]|nr:hypothetical protein BDR03DRAFT_1009492 [Suillus americanus]